MKSFILSSGITALIFIFFMSLFDHKTRMSINGLPNAVFIIITILFFIGYVFSLYWGVTGIFREQRILNFMGIAVSIFGLCIYVAGYMINNGGKESGGQFDHDISKIEASQRTVLNELLQKTNTKESDIQFTQYWGMNNNPNNFVVVIQKGDIIGLQIKNKILDDIQPVSKLTGLSWLVLENCNIKSIADLKLKSLQRLDINHNQITTLDGIENEPKMSWLNFKGNPITDSTALKNHPNKYLYILN